MNEKERFKENTIKILSPEDLIPGLKPVKERELGNNSVMGADYSDDFGAVLVKYFQGNYGISEADRENFREMFKGFKGQIVLDIGAGEAVSGYKLALLAGARAYVAVEPHNYEYAKEQLEKLSVQQPTIPAAVTHEDALSFLQRVPDNSMSILVSGLDEQVLSYRQFPGMRDYQNQVSNELVRVLSKKGAMVNYDSGFLSFDRKNLKSSGRDVNGLQLVVFEKK